VIGDTLCEGPRKVNLRHLVPSVVDSTFAISERSLCLFIIYLYYFTHYNGNFNISFGLNKPSDHIVYFYHCADHLGTV